MLAADTAVKSGIYGLTELKAGFHKFAYAVLVKLCERIVLINLVVIVCAEELTCVITAEAECHLSKVVSTEAEELSFLSDFVSRDDAGKFLGAYYDNKIYENDPFAKLDQTGVGKLMELAVDLGKKVRPEMHCGICGEHGGDPVSVEFCHKIGLDYVSCSPFRVPIARLAAAQAALSSEQ